MSYRALTFRVKPQVIADLESALADEVNTRYNAVSDLNTALQEERDTRLYDDTAVRNDMTAAIADEVTAREAVNDAVIALGGRMDTAEGGLFSVTTGLAAEIEDRGNAVAGEAALRVLDISGVNAAITAEEDARKADVYAINEALSGEAAARVSDISGVNVAIAELAASKADAAGLAAVIQLGNVLCGDEGALAVDTYPGSGVTYVFNGTEQDLSPPSPPPVGGGGGPGGP